MTLPLSSYYGFSTRKSTVAPESHRWPELIGIELELEGINPSNCPSLPGWEKHEDGSLRNGIEYVTSDAYAGQTLENVIDYFYQAKFPYNGGPRTSTHIHLNMTDATDDELRSMFVLMYMIEEGVYNIVEVGRKWAGYSVALSEMDSNRIRNILNPNVETTTFTQYVSPNRNAERYYGFNCSVRRHGTVEFRYFPGNPTREELCSWIDLVTAIKRISRQYTVEDYGIKLETPEDIRDFLRMELGDWGARLTAAYSAEQMLGKLHEVLALSSDSDMRVGHQRVYSLSAPYMALVNKHVLRDHEAAIKRLQDYANISPVHASVDWAVYLDQAVRLVPNNLRPQSRNLRQMLSDSPHFQVDRDEDDEFYDEDSSNSVGWVEEDLDAPDPFLETPPEQEFTVTSSTDGGTSQAFSDTIFVGDSSPFTHPQDWTVYPWISPNRPRPSAPENAPTTESVARAAVEEMRASLENDQAALNYEATRLFNSVTRAAAERRQRDEQRGNRRTQHRSNR